METPITVLIVDDQQLVRAGLRALLDEAPGVVVVGEVASGEEAVREATLLRPQVVLMDVRMPGCGGLVAARRLGEVAPASRVVMITAYDHDEVLWSCLEAGAAGVVLKSGDPSSILTAVRAVASGGAFLPPDLTRRFLGLVMARRSRTDAGGTDLAELSERELDVLRLVGGGLSNHEIGRSLEISEPTVKTHVSNVLRKLGARDRVHAVIIAFESGLVRPGERR